MLVVMRSASERVLIGPILIEHEPSYDEVVVEGRENLRETSGGVVDEG